MWIWIIIIAVIIGGIWGYLSSDEDKKGYSAIGEAVISHIFSEEEITRESLIYMLGRLAEKEADEEHLVSLWQARGILQSIHPPAPVRPGNVVFVV